MLMTTLSVGGLQDEIKSNKENEQQSLKAFQSFQKKAKTQMKDMQYNNQSQQILHQLVSPATSLQ